MEFPGNFSSLKEEMNLQNQGSWVTVTPVKPVPSKMPVVTGGESWFEKEGVSSSTAATNDGGGGFYSMGGNAAENERHRSDGSSSSSFNCTRSLNNNWEEAMAAASVGLGRNQQNHGNLLNFIDLTSAAGGAQRGENSRHPYSMISYPHIHAQQPAIHARKPATLSLPSQKMLLGGMISFNADTYSPQIPPYGFPIPYNPPAHHLNSVSKTQFPLTPENSIQNEKVQNSQSLSKLMDFYKQISQEKRESSLQSMGSLLQLSHATSETNVQNERTQNCKSSSKLTDFGIDERVTQEKNQNGSLPSWGSSLQFAPVTPEKNAQNDQSPAMFIDFVLDERSNQEKNQGYSLQSCNPPGNDAVENCSNQGLSQAAAVHPSQFAPATPGKNVQMETKQNNQSPLIDLGTEEIANKEKNQGSFLSRVSPGNEVIEIFCDQGLAQSSVIYQSQLAEIPNPNKGEINVIDLNKTPQQKPRRKKHRPKVIREQKSSKTPKPVTPKQSGSKENATGRKRNLENQNHKHSKTPLPYAGEPDAAQTGRPHIPSCKRSLNFESETQAGDGGFGTSEICRGEVGNQEDVSEAANLQAVEAPQIENQSLGITLDLNSSMTQAPDSYLPSSQNPTLSSPLKRKIPSKENLKNMARKRSNMGIMSATEEYQDNRKAPTGTCIPQEMEPENIQISQVLQGPESLIESQLDSNIISQPLPTHTKPGFKELNQEQSHPVHNSAFHPSNLIEAHLVPMKTYLEMLQAFQHPGNGSNINQHYPQIYKKERTKRPKNGTSKVVCDMSSFSMSVAQTHMVQNFPREDRAGIGFHKPRDYGSLPALSQIELKTKKRSNTPTRIRNMASFSASKCNQMLAIHPNWTPGHDAKQGHGFSHGPQSCVEALVTNNKSKMVKKKRTKKVSHTVSSTSFSLINQVQARQDEIIIYCDRQCFIGSTSPLFGQKTTRCNASSPRKLETQESHILPTNSVHDCGSSSNLHRIVAMVPRVDPIDEIVQRLKNLNINRGDETAATQTENALVAYVRDGTMVPYEGPFDPMKKRRSRPKVDLDMETLRQWKLLMGKDSSENLEGTDEEKEKWWEEERRVFHGRADSFIARMHLVQGDRRFSQWKGSVVDSVVGVFLTQNVSDHLSSSAFMSLAARFPLQSKTDGGAPNIDGTNIDPPEPDVCVLELNNTMNWQDKVMVKQMPDQSSMTHHEAELGEENQIASSSESFGSNTLGSKANCPEGTHFAMCETGEKMCQQSTENRIDIPATATTGASLAEPEDRRSPEDVSASVVSSQNSTESTGQIADRVASSSESNSETEELITSCRSCSFDSHTSFMELLHMAGTRDFQKFYINENPISSSDEDFINAFDQSKSKGTEQRKSTARLDGLKCPCSSVYQANSHVVHTQNESIEDDGVFFVNYNLNPVELACPASGTTGLSSKASDATEVDVQLKLPSPMHNIAAYNPDANINKSQSSQLLNTKQDASLEIDTKVSNDPPSKMTEPLSGNNTLQICSDLPAQNTTNLLCKAGEAAVQAKSTHVAGNGIHVETLAQNGNFITQQTNSSLVNYKGETLNTVGCSGLTDNLSPTERNIVESSLRDDVYSAERTSIVETYDALKAKKRKGMAEIKKPVDWDSLRTQVIGNGAPKERSHVTMDSLDWEAVRCAEVGDIAHAIRERGMNNMLAERIKAFLDRMVKEHGSIDLEWLRDVPPDKAKDYLLSIRGLGLKSVECVRLLALQHLAFPVDTNVGRICVRLGWVPLQPLPESLQLHLLELYPVLESIQKYLWPRLCKLDQRTLYELHYQLITFGKVFCTKNRPNCNACPMRGECKHFASAFASARLALPGPEEKSLISSVAPIMIEPENKLVINSRSPAALPPPEANTDVQEDHGINKCEPIIEEPATPEYIESSGTIEEIAIEETPYAIEDTPYEDPDEIPTIKLNLEELTLHVQSYIQENRMELQDADTSRALVTLTPEAASIPMPKLKNVNRLRTEHQVYELPDTHPLLEGLDPREPDDPCSYLLAIWTPGETAESIKPPELGCNSQVSGNLCDKETCFSCNSIREANAETVRGTLLIPCRTAMRGSFPLNGTYFQVNEVFADHDSSLTPVDVPRAWIWNLPRRTVFFGTSIPTIFRGLTTEGIQYCFWRGFVCVRGFDRTKRAPRPLMARLHFPASKLTRSRKGPVKKED